MNTKVALAAATLGLLAACADAPTAPAVNLAEAPQLSLGAGLDVVPGELIVKFRAGATAAARAAALGRANGQAGERILTAMMQRSGDSEGLTIVHTPLSVADAIAALRGSEDVEYAEPNYIYQHSATSNDTYYTDGSLWGMYGDATSPANQFGSQAGEAWAVGKTNCSNVYVGIIDEGYMYSHEDLAANAGTNPGEVAGNGVDDDSNGYVDDVYGWDFDGNNSTVFDGTGDDHGTHVAGTIGGVGGNGLGVAGVCWSVKLMDAKFLGRNGGTTANAVKAVDYFTDLKVRHNLNLVTTSNSWGGGGFSQSLADAIDRANTQNILFIAAAGNSTYDCDSSTACYPAEYTSANVIAVASITSSGGISSFSNFGATTIDIGAPGSGIWSSVPKSVKGKAVSGYASYSGTSMATPHVSGAAALYAAYHAGSSAAAIKSAILGSAVPTASLAGKVATGGRLNVSGF
ncbi:MAG TPA: S8 family peptidase [Gemmatimonadaceae bacterium]|nr:S8 family peptidase [Gemmatimonadaceae bacterium]